MVILLCGIYLLLPGRFIFASHPTSIQIRSVDTSVSIELTGANDVGGVSLAAADLGDDGVAELIVGNGMGMEPRVRVLRQDGSEIGSFLAYDASLGVGINITVCDLTGDGYNEIVVAPQRGGGPHIRVFDRYGEAIDGGGFFAYETGMREGVNLACGNLVDDARAELVTLPAAGGGPHVRVWSWEDGETLAKNFFAFNTDDRSGIVGAVHDKKLFLAQQHTSTPMLKTLVIHSSPTITSEESLDIDGLGVASLAVFNNDLYLTTATTSTLYNLTQHTTTELDITHASLAATDTRLLLAPGRFLFSALTDDQRIEVDVSEQRLYAFERGILRNSFLISSGRANSTPLGERLVLAKVPLVHYAWFYGADSPFNYDLGWVPYNLRFAPHIYIHYAPWHNNFGHPMSRGCVNVNLANIQWLYDWAREGTPVEVKT